MSLYRLLNVPCLFTSRGKNEEFLAPFVQKNRDNVFICTKFALIRGSNGSFDGVRGDPEYVKSACEASLKRLGVDSIDLYCKGSLCPQVAL